MSHRYYDDLSAGGERSDSDSSCEEDEEKNFYSSRTIEGTTRLTCEENPKKRKKNEAHGQNEMISYDDSYHHSTTDQPSSNRVVISLDVDCFYCQCEYVENPELKNQPIAIGQKHIVVTCNYIARRYGVQKLQSKENALRICPSLRILDGSDLERYRRYARSIYEHFRKHLKSYDARIAIKKGSMDEMVAEIPSEEILLEGKNSEQFGTDRSSNCIYVYHPGDVSTITEDQTGASTRISQPTRNSPTNVLHSSEKSKIVRDLKRIARIAFETREHILKETGFTTTLGVSTNPLLAKIAAGLKKPHTVNILYPWDGESYIVPSMPLRKIPNLGRQTFYALLPLLESHYNSTNRDKKSWKCHHLRNLSLLDVQMALSEGVATSVTSIEKKYDNQSKARQRAITLLQNCCGIDESPIVDDDGGLPKTVSVENSFRRGSLCSAEGLQTALEDLCRRLPRLLQDRRQWSKSLRPENDSLAYPTTISLTLRKVVDSARTRVDSKRPFRTESRQCPLLNGSKLVHTDLSSAQTILRAASRVLLESFLRTMMNDGGINVTRVNLSVTNFRDLERMTAPEEGSNPSPAAGRSDRKRTRRIDEFFQRKKTSPTKCEL